MIDLWKGLFANFSCPDTGRAKTIATLPSIRQGRLGPEWDLSSGTRDLLDTARVPLFVGSSPFSIAAVHESTAVANGLNLIGLSWNYSGGKLTFPVLPNGYLRSLICWNGHYYFCGGSADEDMPINWDVDGRPHVVVATYDGTTFRFYRDGALAYSVAKSNLTSSANSNIVVGNTFSVGGGVKLKFAGMWNRALSVAEVTALTKARGLPSSVGRQVWVPATSSDSNPTLTGIAITGAAGALSVQVSASPTLLGVAATVSPGIVSVTTTGNVTVNLTGAAAQVQPGNVSVQADAPIGPLPSAFGGGGGHKGWDRKEYKRKRKFLDDLDRTVEEAAAPPAPPAAARRIELDLSTLQAAVAKPYIRARVPVKPPPDDDEEEFLLIHLLLN